MNRWITPLIAASALALGACAAMQKDNFIREQAAGYTYEIPVEQVWPHVEAMLKEQGFSYKRAPGRWVLVTEWKEEMGGSTMAASYTRYLVEGEKLDEAHCRVRFLKNTMTQGGGGGDPTMSSTQRHAANTMAQTSNAGGVRTAGPSGGVRDLNAEWLLMQRAAPEDAQELQTVADEKFK